MNRGLLQALENEAQFAFVMGHELGHVAARHSAARQSRGQLGGLLLGGAGALLGAVDPGTGVSDLVVGVGALGANLLLLSYDRGQELEADRLGALYLARAGYDPREALRAHGVLNRAIDQYLANLGKRRGEPGPLDPLLSTHPRHEARLAELEPYVRTLPPGEARPRGDGRFAERWLRETAGIRALAPAYARYDRARMALGQKALAPAKAELAEALRLGQQAQFWTLDGEIAVRERRYADARTSFARALALYPGYHPALHSIGVAEYAEGRYAAAAQRFDESLRVRPGFTPSQFGLGLSLGQAGRSREAIPPLLVVARRHPDHPAVFGILGQLYERIGDRASAAAAYRAQLRVAPDTPLGRESRRRLQALSPGG
jgi:predicted Zn-dependent protease